MMIATNLDGSNDENGRRGLTKLMELSKDSEFGGGSFKLGPKKLGWLRRARGTVEKEVAATTVQIEAHGVPCQRMKSSTIEDVIVVDVGELMMWCC